MMEYNQNKLRRLNNLAKDTRAAYGSLSEESEDIKADIDELTVFIRQADRKAQIDINREVIRARQNHREPEHIKPFLEYTPDEMRKCYTEHPIKEHLAIGTLERYIALRQELDGMRRRQSELSEKLKRMNQLLQGCKDFLVANGVERHGIYLG